MSAVVGADATTGPSRYVRPRTRSTAWWGIAMMITTESMIFAGLISSYFFLRAASPAWPPHGTDVPDLGLVSIFSLLLLGSSIPTWWAERSVERNRIDRARIALIIAWVMAAAFLVHTVIELAAADSPWTETAYGSVFNVIIGLHALHLLIAMAMSIGIQAKVWTGRVTQRHHDTLKIFSIYWHWVDSVWIVVFASLYLVVRWT